MKLTYLDETEARQLIETPIPDFSLRYEPAAVQHILDLTSGHPYLVQLLCMEVVALKNRQDPAVRYLGTVADIEAAVPATLERGQQFFADIELNQIDDDGRLVLDWLAGQGVRYSASLEEFDARMDDVRLERTVRQLVQRSLLAEEHDLYRFGMEIVRRWFAG